MDAPRRRGVDGAIHNAGGAAIYDACKQIRATQFPDGLPTGKAVITTAGDMPARYVIHTVGPVYGHHNGKEAELLADCYRNSIQVAIENDLSSVAFPSISTGAYGYPKHDAAKVVGSTVREILAANPSIEVRLIFFSQPDATSFTRHAGLCS